MKRLLFLAGMTAVSLLLVAQSAFAVANNPCTPAEVAKGKTTVCHVPPGNPANAMTICVGGDAPAAHLKNHPGDHLGACGNPCGDHVCDANAGENCSTCPQDCGCPTGEVCDAGTCTLCGNGVCDAGEGCGTACPGDCPCPTNEVCNNGTCQPECCAATVGPACNDGCTGCTGTCLINNVCATDGHCVPPL